MPWNFDGAAIAGRDPAPVLEAKEHALDAIALLVNREVTVELYLAVALRRDDGLGSARSEPGTQIIAVEAQFGLAQDGLFANQFGTGRHGGGALLGDPAIREHFLG